VPALARGLQNEDASVRSNAALALYVLSDKSLSSDRVTPRVDIRAALPALIVALGSDSRTGALAAQAIGNIGALAGIGPSAKSALPQLERALADPSNDVRGFARLAIARINGSVPP
jgi:HEAT repeat protein